MDPIKPITVKSYLPAAAFLTAAGCLGLLFLVLFTLPTLGPRWLFFFFLLIAIVGFVLPFVAYLHLRFQSKPPATLNVVVRQSILVGIYSCTLVWLQIGRVLTLGLVFLVAAGLIFLELLMRLRERSQWRPGQNTASQQEQKEVS